MGRPLGSLNSGELSIEARLAEAKERNQKRLALGHPKTKQHTFEGDVFEHLQKLIEKLVRQFISENRRGLFPINWANQETIKRRKDQISVMRDHMMLIKAIRAMALTFAHAPGEKEPELTPEAKALIDSAESLLSKRGMKVDLSPEEQEEDDEWEIADNLSP